MKTQNSTYALANLVHHRMLAQFQNFYSSIEPMELIQGVLKLVISQENIVLLFLAFCFFISQLASHAAFYPLTDGSLKSYTDSETQAASGYFGIDILFLGLTS